MKTHAALRLKSSNALLILLSALSVMLLVSCAVPYPTSTPYDFSAPMQSVLDVLNNPALRIPIFLAGLALLLAGLWLAELIIALPGFVIGAIAGASLGTATNNGHFGILSILLAVVAGLLGAWLALALFYLGVFAAGFGIGFVFGGSIGNAVFNSHDATTVTGVVVGLFAGMLAVSLWKFSQVVISSGLGTVLIGLSLGFNDKPVVLILLWLFGIVMQSGLLKVFGPPRRTVRTGRTSFPQGPPAGPFPPSGQD